MSAHRRARRRSAVGKKGMQTAVCRCRNRVVSEVPIQFYAQEGAHFVQGVNCKRCGTLHIFATDDGHTETIFKDIKLNQFYLWMQALDCAGLLPNAGG